jgi:hypothetical protein
MMHCLAYLVDERHVFDDELELKEAFSQLYKTLVFNRSIEFNSNLAEFIASTDEELPLAEIKKFNVFAQLFRTMFEFNYCNDALNDYLLKEEGYKGSDVNLIELKTFVEDKAETVKAEIWGLIYEVYSCTYGTFATEYDQLFETNLEIEGLNMELLREFLPIDFIEVPLTDEDEMTYNWKTKNSIAKLTDRIAELKEKMKRLYFAVGNKMKKGKACDELVAFQGITFNNTLLLFGNDEALAELVKQAVGCEEELKTLEKELHYRKLVYNVI